LRAGVFLESHACKSSAWFRRWHVPIAAERSWRVANNSFSPIYWRTTLEKKKSIEDFGSESRKSSSQMFSNLRKMRKAGKPTDCKIRT
jgi:hypothetical protein